MDNLVVDYNKIKKLTIGKGISDININNDLIKEKQLLLNYDSNNRCLTIKNLDIDNNLFINSKFSNEAILNSGDEIFIAGVYIYYFGNIILVGSNNITFNSMVLNKRLIKENPEKDYSSLIDKDIKLYNKDDYFQRPPRFKRKIETKVFNIDAPTQKEKEDEMPLIFTIAPMLTMGMMSLVTGITALQKVLEGESTIKDEFSSLLMCGCMMLSMICFPLAQKYYRKAKKKQKEAKRRRKYKQYIKEKREEIFKEIYYQKQVLLDSNMSFEQLTKMIGNKSKNLWERKIEHDDFLELKLGIGTRKPDIDIKYPETHFTMDEDDLRDVITELVNESKDIEDVPITLNFKNNNKVGIIGENKILNKFIDNLMLQVMTYHGYDMLRIIILTNEENKNNWEKYRNLTYLWNNEKSLRYYATNKEDINKITSFLREEYNYRLEVAKDKELIFNPYYLILTDDVNLVKNNVLIKDILKLKFNIGYSVIMCVDKLETLPNECSMFISVNNQEKGSGLFTNEMTATNQTSFTADLVEFSLKSAITNISNIPVDINSGKFVLPKKYGFLEMYDVGNVNQLNILNRWKNNDIIKSLSCPVGIDEQAELFTLDLHEKAHGPHGLVAGMTGSGKSEWIITYILSMAVNYSPEEVQFVLIDYKGGGLALTFDNRENNIKLPHVVGTLTNLDVVEMKRSLASINSELKRRQNMFKSAREKLNESSMDIYKYQEFYRSGKLSEPMSHLFIVSDEFAELKAQQPDFMDELISTARIGRSLGVHLILATQKPSGVVDDQIWSNSKFRVCLKVQDKSDSNDMLKCPDAAMLKDTGRFYLQVGYNEFFAKGQSAYAGMPYYESDKKITVVDSTIDFVDEIGTIIKRGDIEKNNTQFVHKGEELPNILNYIIETAKTQKLKITPLWLSRIPDVIYVDKLKEKYEWTKENNILNPIIGEYDLPSKQYQGLLTLPISKEGNVLIYGSSGSGKENLVTTILYSLISCYSVHEVNTYIIDFGSEVLNNFEAAPHVGDIIRNGDEEKTENLFKFINTEITNRKKKFMSHNGSYYDYVTNTGEKIPSIIIIVNQADIFIELNNKYMDVLTELTRDGSKYGIYFILTSSSINGIKSKISQNFKISIMLQQNDEYNYRTVLGNTNGIIPSKIFGRGLIKLERVVEFQTAYAFERETLYAKIKNVCLKQFMKYKIKAIPIPVLPEIVEYNHINKNPIDISNIPIGIVKKDLGIASINLDESLGYLISSRSFDDVLPFFDKLLYLINKAKDFTTFVIDTKYIYEENKFNNINYLNANYHNILEQLSNYATQIDEILVKNNSNKRSIKDVKNIVCIIVGLDKFVKGLEADDKKLFESIITKTKESNKIHFVFIDVPGNFKKCEYEMWFKDVADTSTGLWVGDGFAEQYAIKPTRIDKSFYDISGTKYAYLVKNGAVEFIKLIEKE